MEASLEKRWQLSSLPVVVLTGVLLDPVTNWVWVSVFQTGVFVAHVP